MVLEAMLTISAAIDGPPTLPTSVDLTWSAPPGCPEGTDVALRIDELLAHPAPGAQPMSVVGRIDHVDRRFVLELRIRTPDSEEARHLESSRCDELARATALIVATLADPIAVSTHVEALERERSAIPEPPGPATSRPVPDAAAIPPISATPNRPRERIDVGGGLRVEGFLGTGTLPRIDGGLGLSTAFIVEHARVELGGAYFFASRRSHPELEGLGLRIAMANASLRACGVLAARSWEFPLCGGTELGAMWARGEGAAVRAARTVVSFIGAAVISAHAVWRPRPRWGLWLGVSGLVHYARPSFTLGALEPFFVVPRVGLRGSAGVEVRFP